MKKTISLLGISILIGHFFVIFLYLGPTNPYTEKYQKTVHRYVNSFFGQNWSLFAPDPAFYGIKLWYRCEEKKEAGPWLDALAKLRRDHQNNRFTYKGKLNFIYTGLARNLYNDYHQWHSSKQCKDKTCHLNEFTNGNNYYARLKNFLGSLCQASGNQQALNQFKVITHYSANYTDVQKNDKKGKIEFITFPVGVNHENI